MLGHNRQRGLALVATVLTLVTVLATMIGLSASRFIRYSSEIHHQQQKSQIIQTADNLFHSSISRRYSITEKLSQTTNHHGAEINLTEQTVEESLDGKPIWITTLTVDAILNKNSTNYYHQSVDMIVTKRLENTMVDKVFSFTPESMDVFFESHFLVNTEKFFEFSKRANRLAASCDEITSQSTGLIWVTGNCRVKDTVIGKKDSPVIIVVSEGELVLEQSSSIYGLIIHLCFDTKMPFTIAANSLVSGAVASSCDIPSPDHQIIYSPDILETLIKSKENLDKQIVEGSWLRE